MRILAVGGMAAFAFLTPSVRKFYHSQTHSCYFSPRTCLCVFLVCGSAPSEHCLTTAVASYLSTTPKECLEHQASPTNQFHHLGHQKKHTNTCSRKKQKGSMEEKWKERKVKKKESQKGKKAAKRRTQRKEERRKEEKNEKHESRFKRINTLSEILEFSFKREHQWKVASWLMSEGFPIWKFGTSNNWSHWKFGEGTSKQ